MDQSLYDVLGVPKDATRTTIRKAYRNKAKTAHPDHGGSSEKFGELKLAHDVLSDANRRRQYDETGEIEEPRIDDSIHQALALLSVLLDQTLDQVDGDPIYFDLHKIILHRIDRRTEEVRKKKLFSETEIKRTEKMIGRWAKKDGGESMMEALVRGRLSQLSLVIPDIERELKVLADARMIVEEHTYKQDPHSIGPGYQVFRTATSNWMR